MTFYSEHKTRYGTKINKVSKRHRGRFFRGILSDMFGLATSGKNYKRANAGRVRL
jgi:hypothetical protein